MEMPETAGQNWHRTPVFEEFNWLFFFSGSLNEVVILPSFQIAVLCPLDRPNSSKHQKILKSSYNWFKYWHSSAAPAADCQSGNDSKYFLQKSGTRDYPPFMANAIKNIFFKSSYDWFRYWHFSAAPAADCQLLVYSAIFLVTSITMYIYKIKPKLCAKHVLTVREWF